MNYLFAIAVILILIYQALKYVYNKLKPDIAPELAKANRKIGELEEQLRRETNSSSSLSHLVTELQEKFQKLQHQKISADVKLGQRYENILPFMEKFPYKDDEIRGLFNPIDLVVFRDEEVVFIEIKTGESQLSEKQRRIRDNIKAGRVKFEVHRMDEKGVKIK